MSEKRKLGPRGYYLYKSFVIAINPPFYPLVIAYYFKKLIDLSWNQRKALGSFERTLAFSKKPLEERLVEADKTLADGDLTQSNKALDYVDSVVHTSAIIVESNYNDEKTADGIKQHYRYIKDILKSK